MKKRGAGYAIAPGPEIGDAKTETEVVAVMIIEVVDTHDPVIRDAVMIEAVATHDHHHADVIRDHPGVQQSTTGMEPPLCTLV